jgi:hypothetical protein
MLKDLKMYKIKGRNSKFVLDQTQCHEDIWGSGGTVPRFLDLGTGWR